MASKKKQSPSSIRWHDGHGQRVKDARVLKSSHGKFTSVAALEAHRIKVNPTNKPKPKNLN